jgi:hypothetical protein
MPALEKGPIEDGIPVYEAMLHTSEKHGSKRLGREISSTN